MEQTNHLDIVDEPDRRHVEHVMRPLDSHSAASQQMRRPAHGRPEQQASRDGHLREVMTFAAEDILEPRAVDVSLDDEPPDGQKRHGPGEDRRLPLFRIGMTDAGVADLTEHDPTPFLSDDRRREQRHEQDR